MVRTRISDRMFENQRYRASGLNLPVATIAASTLGDAQ